MGIALGLSRVHKTAPMIRESISHKVWNNYFKFAFVRNPWDRMVSMYKFRVLYNIEIEQGQTFEEWIWTSNERRKNSPLPLWGPQTAWITENNKQIVDYVGKFESIDYDWSIVCEKIGKKLPLSHHNQTNHSAYWKYYNSETRDLVAEWHKEDIELFGYDFKPIFYL